MRMTGVFATEAERLRLRDLQTTPAVALQCGRPSAVTESHRLAIEHGLPEINGRYGIDLRTGEFIAPSSWGGAR